MKVLVVGGGGREHALCWRLRRSASVKEIYCAPGNAGIARDAQCVPIAAEDIDRLVSWAREQRPDLVVVGPEAPLVAGLTDRLQAEGIAVFGPSAKAAQLEGSKAFAKRIMQQAKVPTARFEVHRDLAGAKKAIARFGAPVVVKASGLAAGKGVVVAQTEQEAIQAARAMLEEGRFGDAGREVVIEECLEGEEASLFFLATGEQAIALAPSQDHKRLEDGDRGPNTGGMGAYSPTPCVDDATMALAQQKIVQPVLAAMQDLGTPFRGVLYVGAMLTEEGPKVLEFNARFGDPECQVLMPRIKGDFGELLLAAVHGEDISPDAPDWDARTALVVVVAARGYPGSYEKGEPIRGLEQVEAAGAIVFHAGTAKNEKGEIVSAGGRVLGVTALGKTVKEAHERAYQALAHLDWPGGFYRRDIGWRAIAREQERS